MNYYSTKKFGPISTGHRNWRALHNTNRNSAKCSWLHGYSRYVEFTFGCETLDEYQWVQDFGNCKFIKDWLETNWDHKMLISNDDPELITFRDLHSRNILSLVELNVGLGWGPGIEGSCKWVYDSIDPLLREQTRNRVFIKKIQIWEHDFNSAFIEL